MNDGNDGPGRPLRAGSGRAAVLPAALAGIALLAAACGGSSPAAGPTAYQKAVSYTRCMRSHGVPDWPNPTSQGTFVPTGIDLGSAQAQNAHFACEYLLPNSASQLSAAQQQKAYSQALKFSVCMRSHGVLNFPDPTMLPSGGVSDSLTGLDPSSPQFQSADKTCQALQSKPGGGGS
jgi:hypothetical protein